MKSRADYTVGQTVEIDDYDTDIGEGGILLRPNPTLASSIDWSIIFTGNIRLTGSLQVVLNH